MKNYSELRNQRQNLREAIPLEKPFTLLFDPSSICNFQCVQCFHSVPNVEKLMPRGKMKLEKFRKIIDELNAWKGPKIKVIRIIGFGEPFSNADTPQMIEYVKKANVCDRLEVTTNGSLLSKEVAESIVNSGLDYIRISIYSSIQEKHERVTGSKIKIERILQNIQQLQEIKKQKGTEKPFVYIKMLDSFDSAENQAFFDMYSSVADEISIEKPHNWLDMEEKSFLSDLYQGKEMKVDYQETMKKVCPQPFKMLSIRQNGDVIVCDPDWMNNTKVGNAFESSLEEIWHGKKLWDFWKMQIEGRRCENESCRRCNTFLTDAYTTDNIDGIDVDKIDKWRVIE